METIENGKLFQEMKSIGAYPVQIDEGVVQFFYPIEEIKSSRLVLPNGAVVRYIKVENEDIADELANLPILFPIVNYWVEELENQDGVILFYVYATKPRKTNPLPLMNRNASQRFKEFNRATRKMVTDRRWLVRHPTHFVFAMAEDQQLAGFYWTMKNLRLSQGLRDFAQWQTQFVPRWNQMLGRVNQSRELALSFYNDMKTIEKIDWFNIDPNNRLRQSCARAPQSILAFQRWLDIYVPELLSIGYGECSYPVEFIYNMASRPVQYRHMIGNFGLTERQARKALQDTITKPNCGKLEISAKVAGRRDGHQFVIFVDRDTKKAKLFDPNGGQFDVWETVIEDEKDRKMAFMANQNFLIDFGLRPVMINNVCFNDSKSRMVCSDMFKGYCVYISYFVLLYALVGGYEPEQVIAMLQRQRQPERVATIETFLGFLLEMYEKYSKVNLR